MITKKRLIKDILITFSVFILAVSIILAPLAYDPGNGSQIIGLVFIVGFPIIAYVIGFFRRLQLYPMECEIIGNEIHLKYYKRRAMKISLSDITDVKMLIHSQRTAVLEFKFFDRISGYQTVQIRKSQYTNFIEFSKKLMSNQSTEVLKIKNNVAKNRSMFISHLSWDEFLNEPKSVKQVILESLSENIPMKVITILGVIILAVLRNIDNGLEVGFLLWFVAIGLSIYLISGILFRLRGYSREESIGYFVCGVLSLFGLCSFVLVVLWIFGISVSA